MTVRSRNTDSPKRSAIHYVIAYTRRANAEGNLEHVLLLVVSGPVLGLCAVIDSGFLFQLAGVTGPPFHPLIILTLRICFWIGLIAGYIWAAEEMAYHYPDEVKDDRVVRLARTVRRRLRRRSS